jgi:UDP-hydrolysing UDP-N-acetyl-D-glucosamine 2-epimerase
VTSEDAKQRVIKMGEDPNYVYNTGCPSIDLAAEVANNPSLDFDPFKKYGGVGQQFDHKKGYLVVMQHPVTTEYASAREDVLKTLRVIDALKVPAFWFWPNVDAGADGTSSGIRSYREHHHLKHIHFFKNMEPLDFLKLLKNSSCLIGNSSVGIRECSYLGVPVVNIGTRQNRRLRGSNVIDVMYTEDAIKNAITSQLGSPRKQQETIYGTGESGKQIADILATIELRFHKTITY